LQWVVPEEGTASAVRGQARSIGGRVLYGAWETVKISSPHVVNPSKASIHLRTLPVVLLKGKRSQERPYRWSTREKNLSISYLGPKATSVHRSKPARSRA
jgi:hypothetical protein